MTSADIAILGTGAFAARILFDLAATSPMPLRVVVAGRNVERVNWLRSGGNARARIFGRPVEVLAQTVDVTDAEGLRALLARHAPKVVVQAASPQASSVIGKSTDAWSRLVAQSSLSVTAVFQAFLTVHAARAVKAVCPGAYFINCCYPDVANGMLKALDLPVTCGVGNVAILAAVFEGALTGEDRRQPLKVLAHYSTIGPFRRPRAERSGAMPRVWIGDREVADVRERFAEVKLTPEPVIDVSGACGVPMLIAMAKGHDWDGHVPGPRGLPGGYPVALRDGALDLALPAGVTREDAIRWNGSFEQTSGAVVTDDGRVVYTGALEERLREVSPALAKGFHVSALDAVHDEMVALRARLLAQAV